ncbi:ATP-dependent DNA helicase RRM3 [Leucoagaricus sp. SymC.cos]|nr:ATP-dependent DNA helicase RRM3 [Leucoagaricus sp. SymC.cos]
MLGGSQRPQFGDETSLFEAGSQESITVETSLTPPPKVVLSNDQQRVLEAVKQGENVFFTGPAGTGKSVLLRAIVSELVKPEVPEAVAVTSTTGIAALAIGVSMLKPDLFNKLVRLLLTGLFHGPYINQDFIAQIVRQDRSPFGGIQVIESVLATLVLAGDFFQLPPVQDSNDTSNHPILEPSQAPEQRWEYVFETPAWKKCIRKIYFLEEVFRQKDASDKSFFTDIYTGFIDILGSTRIGKLNEQQIAKLNSLTRPLCSSVPGVQPALLLSSNEQVNFQNKFHLDLLPGECRTFSCMDRAGWDVYRNSIPPDRALALLRQCTIAPEELKLKASALKWVLLVHLSTQTTVNGSIGKVINFMTISEASEAGIQISIPTNDEGDTEGLDSEDDDYRKYITQPRIQPSKFPYRSYFATLVLKHYECDSTIAQRPTKLVDITKHAFLPQIDQYPVVEFTEGKKLLCAPMFFERVGIVGNIEACRIQVPLILSWAITIHKSQGQTLDFVRIDFNRIFADGQAYVALSRATSMDGLQLVNFHPKKVHANAKVIEWHDRCRADWEKQNCPATKSCPSGSAGSKSAMASAHDSAEQNLDDADFDAYNIEISESMWEEVMELVRLNTSVSGSSWIQGFDNDLES